MFRLLILLTHDFNDSCALSLPNRIFEQHYRGSVWFRGFCVSVASKRTGRFYARNRPVVGGADLDNSYTLLATQDKLLRECCQKEQLLIDFGNSDIL
jgi:hypothetical protein